MTIEHTPTPWRLLSPDQVRGPDGQWICSCEGGKHRADKDAANASKIVLAVNSFDAMQAALTGALNFLHCYVKGLNSEVPQGTCDCCGCGMARDITAALALAERGEK